MDREQARNYLKSSGMSEEQIAEIESAFTCEDAISRQAAIEKSYKIAGYGKNAYVVDVADIEALPSVSTEKTGRWKRISMDLYIQHATAYYCCSECGHSNIGISMYCPNCGAKMGVEE